MKAPLEQILGKPLHYPLEITLANGERHLLPNPDYVHWYPGRKKVVIFPGEEEALQFLYVVDPADIVATRDLAGAA